MCKLTINDYGEQDAPSGLSNYCVVPETSVLDGDRSSWDAEHKDQVVSRFLKFLGLRAEVDGRDSQRT